MKVHSEVTLLDKHAHQIRMINYGDLTIGKSYLRYLWITDMTNNKAPSVIYVPTEANIPILEAGRSSNR
jgi:hypothetical protein